ncbi:hypothetical protein OHU11_30225 [Streptomyces sp. NBC_00257]|uniref:hypothetical protein n=1 Tax=unclassified Streptomyces TaxID=2593676 RepID=UPI0022569A99|nr:MULTISPECIES: hypothetical protein [unclassified Streptomyces]WTB54139.1 hypothetical protein OG832_13640 [Streptomyces sp. NBC_00826]WTH92972.1 hypothetical protein OIC43_30040 [Streptomyces sp. NBC_00825]WTI01704.1 hypothetical protein OHA23_30020 [Streptomyces sp. NBC_00822]MCX4867314.1 hypothetical protein [Streptomyces sp. NBC_00906]MCX4898552.1 hypothetical protein [Streptomyces sp. NBC_00892]
MQTARLRTHVRLPSLPARAGAFSAEYDRVRLIAAGAVAPREPAGQRQPVLGTQRACRTHENSLTAPPRTEP